MEFNVVVGNGPTGLVVCCAYVVELTSVPQAETLMRMKELA